MASAAIKKPAEIMSLSGSAGYVVVLYHSSYLDTVPNIQSHVEGGE